MTAALARNSRVSSLRVPPSAARADRIRPDSCTRSTRCSRASVRISGFGSLIASVPGKTAGGGGPAWKTPEQGAATSVLVATSPLLDGVGGRYFEDCNEAEPNQPGTRRGVAAYALDPEAAARLWQVSAEMLAAVATVAG